MVAAASSGRCSLLSLFPHAPSVVAVPASSHRVRGRRRRERGVHIGFRNCVHTLFRGCRTVLDAILTDCSSFLAGRLAVSQSRRATASSGARSQRCLSRYISSLECTDIRSREIPDPPHHDLRLRAHAPAPRRRSPLAPQPRHNLVLFQAAVEASGICQSLSTA